MGDEIHGFQSLHGEEWKPIRGFSKYEVSSRGRVRNRERSAQTGKCLSPGKTSRGYLSVCLHYKEDGQYKHKSRLVHVLVAEAFLGKRPKGKDQVHHVDNNKLNNRASNLQFVTAMENTRAKPELISLDLARCVAYMRMTTRIPPRELAVLTGATHTTVSNIGYKRRCPDAWEGLERYDWSELDALLRAYIIDPSSDNADAIKECVHRELRMTDPDDQQDPASPAEASFASKEPA